MHRFGWRPQHPDFRDKRLTAVRRARLLPAEVDLRGLDSPIQDQGDLGSCVANAVAGLVQFDELKEALSFQGPVSRLMLYYGARLIEGTTDQDAGAEIRDGMKTLAQVGVCPESDWPYDIATFTEVKITTAPTQLIKAIEYMAVDQTRDGIQGCLADGFPVAFGFSVFDSFESDAVAHTGMVPMPDPKESFLGGHAVVAVGYRPGYYIVRNSWGVEWGQAGYFYMPTQYVENSTLAQDFWTARLVG